MCFRKEMFSLNDNMSMEEIMNNFELKKFKKGEIVKGKIVSVSASEVVVNIGHFADGIILRNEMSNDDEFDINSINVEDEIYVMVISTDDGNGNVALSKKRADAIKAWDKLEESYDKNKIISVKIKEVVKGGLVGYVDSIRVFMPASQTSAKRLENIDVLVGKIVDTKIIEFNKSDKKIIVSKRIAEEESIKKEEDKLLRTLNIGDKISGKVSKILKFGAFVDIGGIEGLIHINELAWTRVRKVEDILSIGDTVEVYIKDIDLSKSRLSLSLKDIGENPWNKLVKNHKVGDMVEGKIVRFIQVGAIAQVDNVEGLIHISEISEENIKSADQVLKIGQGVKVKILSIDVEKEKLSLSIKDATEESAEYMKFNDSEENFGGLADLFKGLKFD